MHFVFVDIAYGYMADRPDTDDPLGGTTSAVCFLARELTKAGIACSLFNRIASPGEAHGIKSLPLDHLMGSLASPDVSAVIFCGRWIEGMVRLVRQSTQAPLIAWTHESAFDTKLTKVMDAFDGAVYVSEWQQRVNAQFVKPRWKQAVIRNAMNPAAANLYPPGSPILASKESPPVLLYAGGFARGAMHLPKILNALRGKVSDFKMEIFCNTDPSGDAKSDEQYIGWLRGLPNVTHVGMVGQHELLRRMKRASLFVSPNPWPETSCISLIEAMATGLSCITTDRAALPETASGFARQIHIENADDLIRFDMPVPVEAFAEEIAAMMNNQQSLPDAAERKLREQVDYFQAHYQWRQRVEEWVEYIKLF